jgi:outer membrane protein OmpA-like peptidoglycan-associated protein
MSITTLSTGSGRLLKAALLLALTLTFTATFTACAWSNKAKGTAVGAATGAAVGAVIGNQTGSTARGAIIGAVVGGTAGAIIGRRMDQQAAELAEQIPGAQVVRIGEGIAVIFDSGLLYDFDSDAVKPAARENLVNLATSLQRHPDSEVLIVGHTDNRWGATSTIRICRHGGPDPRSSTSPCKACGRAGWQPPAGARWSR